MVSLVEVERGLSRRGCMYYYTEDKRQDRDPVPQSKSSELARASQKRPRRRPRRLLSNSMPLVESRT